MIDRDPVPTWQDGPVALLGDAAHAMYPTGSNGGSQAIVDARVLGAAMVEHGVTQEALAAYDAKLCGPISQLILRNRGAGPFGLLNIVDERCGGTFDNIDDVISAKERTEFMAGYKAAAGFAIENLNNGAADNPKWRACPRRTSSGHKSRINRRQIEKRNDPRQGDSAGVNLGWTLGPGGTAVSTYQIHIGWICRASRYRTPHS